MKGRKQKEEVAKPPRTFYTGKWQKSCDQCVWSEPHRCNLHSRGLKNMDIKRCRDWKDMRVWL